MKKNRDMVSENSGLADTTAAAVSAEDRLKHRRARGTLSSATNAVVPIGRRRTRDDTLDTLFQGKLKIVQGREGYRFSLDAVLLARFLSVQGGERIVDLGTGNGVLPLILAFLHASVRVTGLELQAQMARRALNGARLNRLEHRVKILQGDVRAVGEIFAPGTFDAAICNPPYRGLQTGRISPNAEKKVARHEIMGSLGDFLRAGSYLLRVKGRMAIIYPAVRMLHLLDEMRATGIEAKRIRTVHSFRDSEAALVLAEGVKGGRSGVKILSPLIIYDSERRYSLEVASLLAESSQNSGAVVS